MEFSSDLVLETKKLTKRFPGVVANIDIDLKVHAGEIRAIMGENGAGKSTFCNMITGLLLPSEGEIFFEGKKTHFHHPKDALASGIRMVFQERSLIDYLTGAQSICLGLEERKGIFLNEKKIRHVAENVRREAGANLPLDVPVRELSAAEQQMVEILRATAHQPKLLILDEPTASLGNEEVEMLFKVLRSLKEKQVAVIIITHKLDEVFEISDTISIFRNGQLVTTVENDSIDRMGAVRFMLGKDMKSQYPEITDSSTDEDILKVEDLEDGYKLHGISMSLKKGEVLGIYGLLGSGRTEFFENIFGLKTRKAGRIYLEGKELSAKDTVPQKMIERGVVLIPEDRRHLSLFRDFFRLRENISIGDVKKFSGKLGLVNTRKEKVLFKRIADSPELKVKYVSDDQDISQLSGGNQQKIVLGRWIFRDDLKILLLDEPTQGIDVGVKHDIYVLLRELAAKGISIIIVSSELPELTGLCNRLYVIKNGRIRAEFTSDEFDDERVLEMVL